MPEALWQLDDITLAGGARPRLDHVSLTIAPGVTAALGPSGAGKSSLLNLLVGYESPDAGTLRFCAQDDERLAVYWVPQDYGLWPHLRVREHLQLVTPESNGDAVSVLLAQFDLTERADARPDALSEGEMSRVAVARALACEARVLVMDEPFVSVSALAASRYWQILLEHLARTDSSLVFATHVPEAVLAHAKRVVCVEAGRVIYEGTVDTLYHRPPSRQAAECLGPVNWFQPPEAQEWLGTDTREPVSLRPGQIAVEPDDNGPVEVVESRFLGTLAETRVRCRRTAVDRVLYHCPGAAPLLQGVSACIRALLCMTLLLLAGCAEPGAPTLTFKEVRQWQMPAAGTKIPAPRGLAIMPDGNVAVIDTSARVMILDSHGKLLRSWRMPESDVGTPEDLTVLHSGVIAVPDTHYHRVIFFNAHGTVVRTLGSYGEGAGEFIYPVSLAEDPEGCLYVCEYGSNDRVQKFSRDGEYMSSFGSFGTEPGQFQRPSGVVWHQGRVYVADAVNNRIQVFSDTGTFIGVVGSDGTPPRLRFPYDIDLDAQGNIVVAEWGAGRISRIDLQGKLLGRYGCPGRGTGEFLTPWGVAADSALHVLVADTGNRRITELRL